MSSTIRSTDYLIEKALGPIAEFIVWLISAIVMFLLVPHLFIIWVTLSIFTIVCFYYRFFVSQKRFLTKVEISQTHYRSYHQRKCCCCVSKNEPIYYAIFESDEATKSVVPYIAISNNYFIDGLKGQKMLSTYDMGSIIIVQYNQTTWHLFDPKSWNCIFGKNLVHESDTLRQSHPIF